MLPADFLPTLSRCSSRAETIFFSSCPTRAVMELQSWKRLGKTVFCRPLSLTHGFVPKEHLDHSNHLPSGNSWKNAGKALGSKEQPPTQAAACSSLTSHHFTSCPVKTILLESKHPNNTNYAKAPDPMLIRAPRSRPLHLNSQR